MEIIDDAAGVRGREVIPRVIPVASPAAGAEWAVVVPGGVIWYVQSVTAILTTSAAGVVRSSVLQLFDGERVLGQFPSGGSQAATTAVAQTWAKGITTNPLAAATRPIAAGFPSVPLLPSWQMRVTTTLLDVGDQWSGIFAYVLEVIEAPYDVELARDNAALRGITSNAIPQIRIGE